MEGMCAGGGGGGGWRFRMNFGFPETVSLPGLSEQEVATFLLIWGEAGRPLTLIPKSSTLNPKP